MDILIPRLRGSCQLVLLSGDHAREAGRFRALLGETARVEFNQSPLDKLNVIRQLQASGRKVMMVGDGLNDAGALRQSDVGVAVVERAGTFSPASHVILDAAQLPTLVEVLHFSRRALPGASLHLHLSLWPPPIRHARREFHGRGLRPQTRRETRPASPRPIPGRARHRGPR